MSNREHLRRLEQEVSFFGREVSRLLDDSSPDIETLLDRYLEMRTNTAEAVRGVTDAWLHRSSWRLEAVIERVESELRSRFADVIPLEAVHIGGYRGIRLVLYEYLAIHLGAPVSVPRLRALTGDQVHTERRLRELRDLGLQLEAVHSSGKHQYILVSEDPDFQYAAEALLDGILKQVPHWSAARREQAAAILRSRASS